MTFYTFYINIIDNKWNVICYHIYAIVNFAYYSVLLYIVVHLTVTIVIFGIIITTDDRG